MKKLVEKIKGMPLKAKVIACVVAVVIVGSGVGIAVATSSNSAKTEVSAYKKVKKTKKKSAKKFVKANQKKQDEKTDDQKKNENDTTVQKEDKTKGANQNAPAVNQEGENTTLTPANPEPQPEPVDARGEACVHNCGKTVFKDQASYDTFKRFITDNYKLESPDDDFDISMFPASMQEYISNPELYNIPYTYKGVTYYGGTDDTDLY